MIVPPRGQLGKLLIDRLVAAEDFEILLNVRQRFVVLDQPARRNAERLGAAVEFAEGDAFEPVRALGPFDGIVCNPPYVDPEDTAALATEVRDHEPAEALFAPAGDPDHWVQRLVRESRALLKPGGTLLVELGYDQAARVREWLGGEGLAFDIRADLAGIERVLEVPR